MDGNVILVWRDLSGDPGEMYEFICDTTTPPGVSHTFELVGISSFLHLLRSSDLISSLPVHVGAEIP